MTFSTSPRRVLALATLALALAACDTTPPTQFVKVPGSPAAFDGSYAGTASQKFQVQASAASLDGATIDVLAGYGDTNALFTLDAATGRLLARHDLRLSQPDDLARRSDGALVVQARERSVVLSPTNFTELASLPGTFAVSRDGELLLKVNSFEDPVVRRLSTRTGEELPTAPFTLADLRGVFDFANVASDLRWAYSRVRKAAVNLDTGATVPMVREAPFRCDTSLTVPNDATPADFERDAGGFYLAYPDGVLERRALDGSLVASTPIADDEACRLRAKDRSGSYGYDDVGLLSDGTRVGFKASGSNIYARISQDDARHRVWIGTWTPRSAPSQRPYTTNDWTFVAPRGFFAFRNDVRRVLSGQQTTLAILSNAGADVWSRDLKVTAPLSAAVTARYVNDKSYAFEGRVTLSGNGFDVAGTAAANEWVVVRPQATDCVVRFPFYIPNCVPNLAWQATLTGPNGAGIMTSNLDPRGATGAHAGTLRVETAGGPQSYAFELGRR